MNKSFYRHFINSVFVIFYEIRRLAAIFTVKLTFGSPSKFPNIHNSVPSDAIISTLPLYTIQSLFRYIINMNNSPTFQYCFMGRMHNKISGKLFAFSRKNTIFYIYFIENIAVIYNEACSLNC